MNLKTIIVINAKESIINEINGHCKAIYQEKLKIMNIIAKRMKKDDRIFELIEDQSKLLGSLNSLLQRLMNYLWEQPKVVAEIIKNSEIKDLKTYLAHFFVNNFYENILSSFYIEDNLMYVLTISLENEINNLENINQENNFLNDTPCGCLLEELRSKNDIQSFFKIIIFMMWNI